MENLKRIQKIACMIILKEKYVNYIEALETLNLKSLSDRIQMLALRFAQKCLNHDRFSDLFPLNDTTVDTRNTEKYVVNFASTDRLKDSSIPEMQRLLNRNAKK